MSEDIYSQHNQEKVHIGLKRYEWERVVHALRFPNLDTTDFPNKPCRNCGAKDRPQYKGTCNDGHCDRFETPTEKIYKSLCGL